MSEADHAGQARPDEPTDDRKLIDELIFRQYLDEVHLLMDFVSGRADRSLAMLTMPNPAAPGETMTSGAIVKAISEMRYPPGPNSAINAENAAILLMAKDRLSAPKTTVAALAQPPFPFESETSDQAPALNLHSLTSPPVRTPPRFPPSRLIRRLPSEPSSLPGDRQASDNP